LKNLLQWVKSNKQSAYTVAILLMLLPTIPLYFAAQATSIPGVLIWLGMILAGNLLALFIR
jgi:hypothetical protein